MDDLTRPASQYSELYDLAQEAGCFGIFEWNVPEGRVSLSHMALSLYGLSDFDGRYETWRNSIFREDQVRIVAAFESAFEASAREIDLDFRVQNAQSSGLRWMEGKNLAFYDDQGRAVRVVGVHVDVTARKRALMQLRTFADILEDRVRERTRELEAEYAARQKAEESLRQAQKMEAVGQLTGGVAHDFNNLLTIVLGGLETIGRQLATLPDSPTKSRIIRSREMSMEGVKRAATLTSRLLAFSRQQPLTPTVIDANKLVAGICDLLRRSLGETIALETVQAAGLWRAFADVNQLENAILNIALNARDAMPNGGQLTIETANCSLDESYVGELVEPVTQGQYVLVAITDTGSGMDRATLDKAFEPFFTTKGPGKGTGLGLSQVYGFVRQSSGHVKVYSEPGQGTTVKIYLPRHHGPEVRDSDADAVATAPARGEELILVVEDDAAVRSHSTATLRELGYEVLEASNGHEALSLLEKHDGIALLFTDVVMPAGMNGRELAQKAQEIRPKLRVLFTTGYTKNAIIHHGRLDAGVRLIAKPFTFDDLARQVRASLDAMNAETGKNEDSQSKK